MTEDSTRLAVLENVVETLNIKLDHHICKHEQDFHAIYDKLEEISRTLREDIKTAKSTAFDYFFKTTMAIGITVSVCGWVYVNILAGA